MNAVWIVDDDESIRWVLERALTREGFDVRAFAGASECLAALDEGHPGVLVSDIRMPGTSGLDLLQQFRLRRPATPVIIMTAYSDLDSAVSALQGGAYEYLPKPFDVPAAVDLVRRALDERSREVGGDEAADAQLDMLGQAPAMQDVFRAIGRLSQSSATVLITGESGTGKELVARALHKHSPRAAESFVALNTAAIPRELLESELFGHERGAFTGALQLRRGRFEQARGGTLFLDEIGDMPPEMQTRLLRVLSDGQYYRVGGQQPLKAEARVIAATHQNLEERVRDGRFREDLFHRLNVIRLRLPPLRERRDDIPMLVRHFLQRSARELGGEPKRLSAEALQAMIDYEWPGNVRQLENACHWLTVMAPSTVVGLRDLPPELRSDTAQGPNAARAAAPFAEPGAGAASGAGAALVSGQGAAADAASAAAPGAQRGAQYGAHYGAQDGTHGAAPSDTSRGVSGSDSVYDAGSGAASAGASDATVGSVGAQREAALTPPLPQGRAGHEPGSPVASGLPVPPAIPATAAEVGGGFPGLSATAAMHAGVDPDWEGLLAREVAALLAAQPASASATGELMDRLTREFEATVIATALRHTGGRRIEAAQRLGIGRNTITRKIQELGLEDEPREGHKRRNQGFRSG